MFRVAILATLVALGAVAVTLGPRLIQEEIEAELTRKLKPGGTLHLATDWENYAEQMMEVVSAAEGLENMAGPGMFAPRPDSRPLTKFEARGERLGHGVWDLLFRRI